MGRLVEIPPRDQGSSNKAKATRKALESPDKLALKELIDLLESGKFSQAEDKLKDLDIRKYNHLVLREFLLFSSYSRAKSPKILSIVLKHGGYEKNDPDLALKIHAVTGNLQKMKQLLEQGADINCTKLTYKNCIADLLVEERPELIEGLAELPLKQKPHMSQALVKACDAKLVETLKTILKHKKKFGVTDEDLRDCAYHSIVRGNATIFKETCQHASDKALLMWKRHFETMHQTALKDTLKRKYDKEIAIVNQVLLRRKLKNEKYEIWDIEI